MAKNKNNQAKKKSKVKNVPNSLNLEVAEELTNTKSKKK